MTRRTSAGGMVLSFWSANMVAPTCSRICAFRISSTYPPMLALRMARYTPTTTVMNNDAARSSTYLRSRIKVTAIGPSGTSVEDRGSRIENRDLQSSIFHFRFVCGLHFFHLNFVSSLTVTNRKVLKEGRATSRDVTANSSRLEPDERRPVCFGPSVIFHFPSPTDSGLANSTSSPRE